MNKHILLVCSLTVGTLGCLGGDKEMNSQCLPAPCPWDVGGGTGTAGTGNSTGTGGTGGGGNPNGAIVGSPLATFDTGLDGFMFGTYDEPPNLNGASSTMHGTLSFDGAVGNPTPGSMKVVAPYSGANQYVDVQKSFGTGNPQDWTGKTLHVRIRATEGTFKGGAQVYAITTGSFVFGGKHTNFMPNNNWQEFTVDVSAPTNGAGASPGSGYDPTKVVVFGVQLNTDAAGAGATPVTFNIDSFSIDPPIAGTAGTAGTSGGAGTTGGAGTSGTGGSGDASVGN